MVVPQQTHQELVAQVKQFLCQVFCRYLPAIQNKLDDFEVHIFGIENILFHEIAAGAFRSEVDHFVIAKVSESPWRIERRYASDVLDAVLKPDQFRDHEQVLHDTTGIYVAIIFVDCEVVAFLVFERNIDECLVFECEEFLFSFLNVFGD